MSKNQRYFTCHRYSIDIQKRPTSKVPIRIRYRYIDIGDISTIFSIYRPTSTLKCWQRYCSQCYQSQRCCRQCGTLTDVVSGCCCKHAYSNPNLNPNSGSNLSQNSDFYHLQHIFGYFRFKIAVISHSQVSRATQCLYGQLQKFRHCIKLQICLLSTAFAAEAYLHMILLTLNLLNF